MRSWEFGVFFLSRYIREGMYVEVGKSEISPSFDSILELLLAKGEHLAFAPDTNETNMMINLMSMRFPLLKVASINNNFSAFIR